MKIVCPRKIERYRKKSFDIGIDIESGISVPESTEIPKYRISFGIPSSGENATGAKRTSIHPSTLVTLVPTYVKLVMRLQERGHRSKPGK